jgi:hypothetical protein
LSDIETLQIHYLCWVTLGEGFAYVTSTQPTTLVRARHGRALTAIDSKYATALSLSQLMSIHFLIAVSGNGERSHQLLYATKTNLIAFTKGLLLF